jgi:hypothetical protein
MTLRMRTWAKEELHQGTGGFSRASTGGPSVGERPTQQEFAQQAPIYNMGETITGKDVSLTDVRRDRAFPRSREAGGGQFEEVLKHIPRWRWARRDREAEHRDFVVSGVKSVLIVMDLLHTLKERGVGATVRATAAAHDAVVTTASGAFAARVH